MLGGPTQEDDVFVDLTTQYDGQGYSYEDTLKHELRHRGLRSERAARLNDVPEGARRTWRRVAGSGESLSECRTPRTPYIRAYTPVAEWARENIEELGYTDRQYLREPKRTGGEPFRRYDRRRAHAVRVHT